MPKSLVTYLTQRSDAFLLPADLGRTIEELFGRSEPLLPQPIKIYPADETQPAILGFPLAETNVLKELDAKLDKWLGEEVPWQVTRIPAAKDKAHLAWSAYLAQLMRVAENAMTSSLLSDHHAIFWLAHSLDLAKQFSSIPRRVSVVDVQAGRTQGDAFKYRIFSKWCTDTRDEMSPAAAKASSILEGDEQSALQFFRLLQDDVLILTEEFVGPDLRELRSFVTGYLRRDFQAFRDAFERLRTTTTDLLQKDRVMRSTLPLFGANPDQGVTLALLLDARFQNFLFDHPSVQNVLTREDREQIQLIGRRVREFAVLNQLRRGIVWMTTGSDGRIVSADRRTDVTYSRTTRALDFGKPGVVDPIIHRFGLIYDISKFSETLGNIRRGGGKEEVKSYRQMLLFQRKLEGVAERHLLQFEKFLGDGAFYTTRRALRLIRAAVEIQRVYSEMKRKGFAFNRGLRIALNYGYYRLLPMKASTDEAERITEFYGPGIVELSRLTTGKADKEIEEIAQFLVSHGYDQGKVQLFFAPLAKGVDVIDHTQHAREYYAYVNANGHLMNEGIVASLPLLQELSTELQTEGQQLQKLKTPWGSYIGFAPALPGFEFVGIRLLGMVQLKGLENIDVGEIVPFAQGEAEATPIELTEPLVTLLRLDFHQERMEGSFPAAIDDTDRVDTTTERLIATELVICVPPEGRADDVVIGEWDPRSDDVSRPLRLPRGDFQKLFALKGDLDTGMMKLDRMTVRDLYDRLADDNFSPTFHLADYRQDHQYEAYVIGEVVEKL
ncbi:MAG TPA: hypothetical protein VGS96_08355 [Thermoanaerobaculia bacterium]|nr:hypothetical protein [Thermoanaerobaculia bacterium]